MKRSRISSAWPGSPNSSWPLTEPATASGPVRPASCAAAAPRHASAEQQLVGEPDEVGVQVAADHVAQQRAQVVGDLARERPRAGAARRRCRRSIARSSAIACSGALGQREPALGRGAERRQAPGEHAARGALGLEQRAQREQVVAQRLDAGLRARSRARSGAAPTRARCRAGARRETRLQNARSSSSCSAVTTSIPCGRPPVPSAQRRPRAAADPRPGERAKRDAPVAEQAQRAQQVAQHVAAAFGRALGRVVVLAATSATTRWPVPPRSSPAQRLGGRPSSASRLGDRQAGRQRAARRGDRQAVQRWRRA